jgi:dTDP-4-amino-4,6-dideoxygalactose transaminase
MAGTGTSPSVPLFDLRLAPADVAAVQEVLRGGRLAAGERVAAFEAAFAAHLGCRHAVAVSSCTAALHLAYLAAGVGPGDEVVVPSITFAATANAARYCGATPVFADVVGPHDVGLDPEDVAARITDRTRAVCVVHFGGYPAAVRELRALCDERGIALVEDAAHAPSGDVDGRRLGTFGLAGAFSFFSNKVLSVGEGGLLATDDDEVAALARRLRDPEGGLANLRMDEWRAALLLSRLEGLEADVARRRELTRRYRERLAGDERVVVPYRDEDVARSSCYVMPVLLADGDRRPEVRTRLREEHGVQTSVLYPAIHEFTAYRGRPGTGPLPRSEHVARAEVTLPLFPGLDEATLDRVVDALRSVL